MENINIEIEGIAELLFSENKDSQNLGFELVKSLNLYKEVREFFNVDFGCNEQNYKAVVVVMKLDSKKHFPNPISIKDLLHK